MKYIITVALMVCMGGSLYAQKKVYAAIDLVTKTTDSISVPKGKSFVVQLPVHNRNGDDWRLEKPAGKCDFTASMLGQAGMLPNQPEPKLFFFKARETGLDSIRFLYKNPRAAAEAAVEMRVLKITIN